MPRSKSQTAAVAGPAEQIAGGPKGKLGELVKLLSRPEGATIEQLVTATGWQAHSVRGAMSGSLKKKLGLAIASVKEGDARRYRIASPGGGDVPQEAGA